MEKMISGWLIYKMENGEPCFLGIVHTKKAAEKEIEVLNELGTGEWLTKNVLFLGWGIDELGMAGTNSGPWGLDGDNPVSVQ